jgi:hypothetical protein
LTWLNLLCLDAPLVAVAWQWLFARSLHVEVPSASRLGLFLTAWLIYLIDRFIDATSLAAEVRKSARQRFCANHKLIWLALAVIVALLDAMIVFDSLDRQTAIRGMLLGTIAVAYLVINWRLSKLWETLPLKEISVGCLFTSGTLVVLAPQVRVARSTISFAAILFASLCALNCISIAVWERDLDHAQRKHSIATRWQHVRNYAQVLLILLASACALLAFLDPSVWPLAICLGASAVFLFALHFLPINRDDRTALADLVLLTPLVFFLVEKIV